MSEKDEPVTALSKHRLLTDADLAERWGVSKHTVGELRRSGVIPFIHITPKLTRFRLEDIEEYEQRQRKVW